MNLYKSKKYNYEVICQDFIDYYKQKNASMIIKRLFALYKEPSIIQNLNTFKPKELDKFKQVSDSQFTDYINFIQAYIDWLYQIEINKQSQKNCLEFFINQTTQQLLNFFENIQEIDGWFLPVIKFHLRSIKKYYKGQLDDSIHNIVMKIRSFLQQARKGQIKRGLYQVILNQYVSIYFMCNNYALCSQTLTSESQLEKTLPIKESYKSEKIIFLYYAGRMKLFENKFKQSQDYFQQALNLCKKNDVRHKRQILKYLIPVKMFCGYQPTVELLQQYSLFEYVEIAEAIFLGNLAQLQKVSKQYRKLWIERGLFLLFDKLRLICIRNLFKKVWSMFKKVKGNEEKNQLPLELFKVAYQFSQKQECNDKEVACIIGNLCMLKFVKGYIFNTNTVVLKKGEDPFPQISTIVDKGLDLF